MDKMARAVLFGLVFFGLNFIAERVEGQGLLFLEPIVRYYIVGLPDVSPQFVLEPECKLLDKIDERDYELERVVLKMGKKRYVYFEDRITISKDGRIFTKKKRITDVEKDIVLRIINLDTCETEIVRIQKRGKQLISPPGYIVRVVKRVNGVEWNGRNTHFQIVSPRPFIVLRIAWPEEASRSIITEKIGKKGRKIKVKRTEKYVRNIVYTPYSADDPATFEETEDGVHTPEISAGGAEDLLNIVDNARQILRDKGVMSKIFPQYTVGDTPFISPKAYARLIVEQIDLTEFRFDSMVSVERALVILRTNRNRAFATCNSSKPSRACGAFQFTDRWRGRRPGTYSTVVRAYPEAELVKNFPEGAFNHVNAAMAAILLLDLNLKDLVNEFGLRVTEDLVILQEVLFGTYNGSPRWVRLSLREYYRGKLNRWSDARYLRTETRGYLEKQSYLIENDLP